MDGRVEIYKDHEVRRFLWPLATLAQELGTAIVGVRHLTKSFGQKALYRGGGSIGFIAGARSALLVGQDPNDTDRRILAVSKTNLGPVPPAIAFRLDTVAGVARVEWLGGTTLTAEDLSIPPPDGQSGSKIDQAIEFLLLVLANGPVLTNEIKATAERLRFSWRTLERAKKELEVEAVRLGQDSWARRLPEGRQHRGG